MLPQEIRVSQTYWEQTEPKPPFLSSLLLQSCTSRLCHAVQNGSTDHEEKRHSRLADTPHLVPCHWFQSDQRPAPARGAVRIATAFWRASPSPRPRFSLVLQSISSSIHQAYLARCSFRRFRQVSQHPKTTSTAAIVYGTKLDGGMAEKILATPTVHMIPPRTQLVQSP